MAQTAVFITLSDDNEEVTFCGSNIPTEADIIAFARGYDYEGVVTYNFIAGNIGEGESNTDHFIDEETLVEEWCNNNYDKFLEKYNLSFEMFSMGSGAVIVDVEDEI